MKDGWFGYVRRMLLKIDYYFSLGKYLLSTYYMLDIILKFVFINMNKYGFFIEFVFYWGSKC